VSVAYPRFSSARSVWILDAALVAWTIAWIVLAILIAQNVRDLSQLSRTVVRAGVAIEDTGEALGTLGSVPFVGDRLAELSDRITQAGTSAKRSGRASREGVRDLSVLLGIAIGVIPSVPLFALYAPMRISRVREVRSVRRALASGDRDFTEYLARRAVENLPYHRLREITANPWRDLEDGRFERLAHAELERLGLRRRIALK
jgi:hypothetical protein